MPLNVGLNIDGCRGLPDKLTVVVKATLFGNCVESEKVIVGAGTKMNLVLKWPTEKKAIQKARANHANVRLELFAESEKFIGRVMIPLRTAQTMKDGDELKFTWVRLARLSNEFKAVVPELNVALSIREYLEEPPVPQAALDPLPEEKSELPPAEPAPEPSTSDVTSDSPFEKLAVSPLPEPPAVPVSDTEARVDVEVKPDEPAEVTSGFGVTIEDLSESDEADIPVVGVLVTECQPSTYKVVESTIPKDNQSLVEGELAELVTGVSKLNVADQTESKDNLAEHDCPIMGLTRSPARYRRFVVEIVVRSIHWKQPLPLDCHAIHITFVHPRRLSEMTYRAEIDLSTRANLPFANVMCRLIFISGGSGDGLLDKFGPTLHICNAESRVPLAVDKLICFKSAGTCNGEDVAFGFNTFDGLRLCKVYIRPSITEIGWETEIPTSAYDLMPIVLTDDCFLSETGAQEK